MSLYFVSYVRVCMCECVRMYENEKEAQEKLKEKK